MKNLFLLCLLALTFSTAKSQVYASAGSSVCQGDFTYAAEIGYYNSEVSLGIGDEYTPGIDSSNYISFRTYVAMASFGDFTIYDYAAMKVNAVTTDLLFETGPIVYFTHWENIQPSIGWTFNFSPGPLTSSVGIALNYYW